MTPAAYAQDFARKVAALRAGLVSAEADSAADLRREAVTGSSGRVPSAALAAANHPFSRARPNAAFNPSIINVQSGRLVASWYTRPPRVKAGALVSGAYNTSKEAGYMDAGTGRMVARPLAVAAQRAVRPRRAVRLARAVADALR